MIQQSPSWMYIQKKLIQKDSCTPMFIAALFTTAKSWKQARCPSANERINKKWCIFTVECKENEISHLQQHGGNSRRSY